MVKAIILTKENIQDEIAKINKWIKEGEHPLESQVEYAENLKSHYHSLLTTFDYNATEVEIIKESIWKYN